MCSYWSGPNSCTTIVGAIVGSVVGSMISGPIISEIEDYLTEEEKTLINVYHTRYKKVVTELAEEERVYYNRIMAPFNKYEELEDFIFDQSLNSTLRLSKSAEPAEEYGVGDGPILRNVSDVDMLFM